VNPTLEVFVSNKQIASRLEQLAEQKKPSGKGKGDDVTSLMGELAAIRDGGKLSRKDIEAANEKLSGDAFEFQTDGKGGFVVQINGFVPDNAELRKLQKKGKD
jgi:hypothetical protein